MEDQYAIQACLRYSVLGRYPLSDAPLFKLPLGYAFWRLVEMTPHAEQKIKVLETLQAQLVNTRTAGMRADAAHTEPHKLYKRWRVSSSSEIEAGEHNFTIKPDYVVTIDLRHHELPKHIWAQAKRQLDTLNTEIQEEPSLLFGFLSWDIMIKNAVFRSLGELMFSEMPLISWPDERVYQPGLDYSLVINQNFKIT